MATVEEPQRSLLARAAKEVLRRRRVDAALDGLRFRIDTFPRSGALMKLSHSSYQPLPWVGIDESKRAAGSHSRWEAIASVLDELPGARTGMDLGANSGFFTIRMAERGIPSIAVESEGIAYRTALYAIRRTGVDAGVLTLLITPETLDLLPEVDVVLCLSLWHHFVRSYGYEQATEMLRRIWERTRGVLFFDTGENEMPPSFRLPPMTPDAETWLDALLRDTCAGGDVRHLGHHAAFDAEGNPAQRNLFAVVRAA
jgi:hypothetical protein